MTHIFINVRDRYITTRKLTEWCLSLPDVSVHLVDNASTYPLLLEWYKVTSARVHYLGANLGPTGVFKPIGKYVRNGNYVISDCDIDPTGVPRDTVERMNRILAANPRIRKVGLAMRIADLPDNSLSDRVCETEAKYWNRCETTRDRCLAVSLELEHCRGGTGLLESRIEGKRTGDAGTATEP